MGTLELHNLPRWLCGSAAVVFTLFSLYLGRGSLPIVFASLFLLSICITDTLYARIPNPLTLLLALSGFVYHVWLAGSTGLLTALLGLLTGLVLLLPPYLLGGMGAGDVKALAALGAVLGAGPILQVFCYMALAGGLMALLQLGCERRLLAGCRQLAAAGSLMIQFRDARLLWPSAGAAPIRFPYAAAIALGFVAHGYWGDIF